MSFRSWLRNLLSILARQSSQPRHARFRPCLDSLEDRLTPAFNLTIGSAASVGVLHDAAGNFTADASGANISVADIQADLAAGHSVTISNGASGNEAGDITWQTGSDLDFNGIGTGLSLTISADTTTQPSAQLVLNSRVYDANIATPDALNVTLSAQHDLVINDSILAGGGTIVLQADAASSGTGTLHLTSGATVDTTNSGPSGVTLRGADLDIQGTVNAGTPRTWYAGLSTPTFAAVDANGNLYVSNSAYGTVSEYAADGTLINGRFAFGLNGPQGLAFDADGNLYVANNSGTVSEFSPAGTLLNASFASGLRSNYGLAFYQGNLYVANDIANSYYGQGYVSEFSADGTLINNTLISGLSHPKGLAFDQSGNLYVADSFSGTVGEYTSSGAVVNASFATGLSNPTGLVFDTQGNLDVANQGNSSISQITPQGVSTTLASTGLSGPVGLAFAPGNLYVVNQNSNSVSTVAGDGTVSTLVPAVLSTPTYEAFGKDGNLYVANSSSGTVSEFSPSGTLINANFISGLSQIGGLAFDASGNWYVANVDATGSQADRISQYDAHGTPLNLNFATLPGSSDPAGLAIDASGNFYLADQNAGTVSKFAADGSLVNATFIAGLNSPASLAFDAAGNLYVGSLSWGWVSVYSPSGTLINADFVDTYDAAGLAFDAAGNLYVASPGHGVVSEYSPSGAELNYYFGSADLSGPQGVAFDAQGNLYVANQTNNSITLVPATGGTVVVRSSDPARPINVGDAGTAVAGINLSTGELSRLVTGPHGTVVVGAPNQTGDITFSSGSQLGSSGAALVALQDTAGSGKIVLNDGPVNQQRVAIQNNFGNVSLTAGTGGITGMDSDIYDSVINIGDAGTLRLVSGGAIGSSAAPLYLQVPNLGTSTAAGSLYVSDNDSLTTTGAVTADGTLNFTQTSGIFTTQAGDLNAGAINLDFNGGRELVTGGQAITNLTHDGSNEDSGTLTLDDNLTLTGSFTNRDGASDVNVTGRTVTVGGNWSWGNSGKLISDFSTVVFDGTGQSISGSTNFYNVTKTVAVPDTLTFQAGSTQNIAGVLTLEGTYNSPLSLRSSVPGSRWSINPQGYRAVANVDVQDSFNSNAYPLTAASSTNSGANVNWTFPPNILAFLNVPPSTDTAVAGQTLPAFQVAIEDANGNVITAANGPVTVSLLGGAFAAGSVTEPAVNGIATFSGLIDDSAGADTLQVADAADGLAPITTPIRIDVGSPATLDVVAGAAQSVPVDTAYSALKAQVTDAYGNPVAGVSVTFAAPASGPSGSFAGNATVTTNAQGVAVAPAFTAGHATGSFTVTASVEGLASTATFYLANTAGAAASISVAGGDVQATTAGSGFGTRLQALVVDADGNPVANVPVTFLLPARGPSGRFDALATVPTNALGIATAPDLTANRLKGSFTVSATAAGVAGSATFQLANTAAPALIHARAGSGQATTVTQAFGTPLQARVFDAAGRPISGVTVTFALPDTGPSATFAGSATAVTNANGIAIAPPLTAGTIAGTFQVLASVAGLASPAVFTLTNRAGPAVGFTLVANTPQSAMAGMAFAQRFQVQVIDAQGNRVAGARVTFTAPSSGITGSFNGARQVTVKTNANGLATAPVFTAGVQAGSYTVTATLADLDTTVSFELTNLPRTPG